TISNNIASDDGGGMSCYGSDLTLSNCTISNNNAAGNGGGIACNSNNILTLSGCMISNNTAGDAGGGIYHIDGGNSILSDTTVCGNVPYQIYGFYSDEGGNTLSITCEPACDEDVAGNDQVVDGADLDVILSLWNQDVDAIDISGDGIIGITDLLMLLEAWGPCP
ncbi:MAG: right-handed parallel beta-helix repeat-containing protein, partial [Phycisphaerales bacterium]|nr:right-handed parallel beta-helix repeat-containing protein [Phycisphaerales bacterium]